MRSLAFVLSSYSTVNMLLEVSSWSVCLIARLSTAYRLAIQHTIHLSTSYSKPVSIQIARSLGRLRSVRDLLSKVAGTSRKENTEVEDAQGEEIRHANLPRRDDLAGGCGLSKRAFSCWPQSLASFPQSRHLKGTSQSDSKPKKKIILFSTYSQLRSKRTPASEVTCRSTGSIASAPGPHARCA